MRISNTAQTQAMRYNRSIQTPSTRTATQFSELISTKERANVDTLTRQSPSDDQKGSLSSADIQFLASEYDPKNMSQSKYDEFLEYLHDKGVISKDEMITVGYHGMATCPASLSSYSGHP